MEVRQVTNFTCGVASALSVVRHYKTTQPDMSERDANSVIHATPRDGSTAGGIARFLRMHHVRACIRHNSSREAIRAHSAQGHLVIVLYQKQPDSARLTWKDGHWAVVVKCTAKSIVLMDPSKPSPGRARMSWDRFERRWYDNNGHSPAYRLAIFTRPPRAAQ